MGCYKLHTEDYFLPLRVVRGGVYKKIKVNARDIGAAEKMEIAKKNYLLKDHLGNVRVVITEEQQQDIYPAATLEPALVATEMNYYTIDPNRFILQTAIPSLTNPAVNYQNNNITTLQKPNNNPSCGTGNLCTTANSTKLYRLKSSEAKTGLGITLKVMAGDKIDVAGKSYFFESTVPPSSNNLSILNIITGFLGGATGAAATAVHGAVTPGLIDPGSTNQTVNDFFTNQSNQTTTNKPRAFINVIFFDEQFKVVDFKVSAVGTSGALKDHYNELNNIAATNSGFVYIYCSNESDVNVYFDNVQVVHTRGAILEESHFYPFGLKMDGISSRAAGGMQNKRLFNGGNELQSAEFSDGSGMELYDATNRMYDPQLGRFWQIDELGEGTFSWSPYQFAFDNPLRFNDPLGLEANEALADGGKKKKFNEMQTLETVVVTSKPRKLSFDQKQDLYWQVRNGQKDFMSIKSVGLRKWVREWDGIQGFMENVHRQTHEQDMIALEVGSMFIPTGWITELRYVKYAATLFKLKRGVGAFKLLTHASEFGIDTYRALKKLSPLGTEVHHLIEKRFASLFGQSEKDMLSIVVTQTEHDAFTKAWQQEIGYNGWKVADITTGTAVKSDVEAAAQRIYKNYPEILNALGL
jgi:RHS repeat-associated protein